MELEDQEFKIWCEAGHRRLCQDRPPSNKHNMQWLEQNKEIERGSTKDASWELARGEESQVEIMFSIADGRIGLMLRAGVQRESETTGDGEGEEWECK